MDGGGASVKAVVDTNVVAYLLLGTAGFVDEAKACFNTVSNPIAPAHWEAELTNVVWMAVRSGILPPEEGPVRLGLARRLGVESVTIATLCQGALLRSVRSGIAVSDTLFVELAARTGCPLLTFDKAVIKAFPDIAIRPRDLPKG
ncbi:MAG: PIN domain-containing protein [Acidobacteria bacterium]|nr:PIN domain-containing protein [Acidobacteriota bacterium]